MGRSQVRDQGAAPNRAGHFLEEEQEQHSVGGVKQDVDEMMPARLHAEPFDIEHVGNPGQRNPIARCAGLESPGHTLEIEAGLDMRIFRDVNLIIESEKIVVEHGRENRKGDRSQGHANPPQARRNRMFLLILNLNRNPNLNPRSGKKIKITIKIRN